MKMSDRDADLLAEYVTAFAQLDERFADEVIVTPPGQADGSAPGNEQLKRVATAQSALEALYRGLSLPGQDPIRFPPLYEALLLSYRWPEADLGAYRLLPNEPAEDLSPLLVALRADRHLYTTLVPNGYMPFGKGPDVDYDPVCFDMRQRRRDGDCRIVRLDHEAALCRGRIRERAELAPSFRDLALDTIRRASASRRANTGQGGEA